MSTNTPSWGELIGQVVRDLVAGALITILVVARFCDAGYPVDVDGKVYHVKIGQEAP